MSPLVRRIGLAALTLLAIGLLSPVLVKVYGQLGQTFTLAPGWLLAIGAMIVAVALRSAPRRPWPRSWSRTSPGSCP